MENYIVLVLLLLTGYALRYVPAFPRETANSLNLFVIYVSLPALILHKVPGLEISAEVLVPVTMPWVMLVLSALAVYLLSRAMGWSRKVTGTLLLVVPLGNTSFLGIPMVTGFFGEPAVAYALLYDQFGTFMGLTTYGTFILATYGGSDRPSLRMILKKIATFPPFIALALALATRWLAYPEIVKGALGTIAASLVPVVMVAVGFQLKLVIAKHDIAPFAAGLSIKLVLAPLAALGIVMMLGSTGDAAQVSVFEAGMAPMITAGALAIMGGLAKDLAAAMVGYGLVLAFVTLPLLHALIQAMI